MPSIKQLLKPIKKRVTALSLALLYGRRWTYLVVHNRRYTAYPERIVLPMLCGKAKGKLSCPDHLAIVLVHNYERETILEKSLHYVGIDNYVHLRPKNGQWRGNTQKLVELKQYIDSGDCTAEYILYVDSDDAVLREDPRRAIQYLHDENCDILFSATPFPADQFEYIPDARPWADELADQHGKQLYLNAGVFVARTDYLSEFLEVALEFVTEECMDLQECNQLFCDGTLHDVVPEFPKGTASDQIIIRHLHRHFHPRMKIDFKRKLALR